MNNALTIFRPPALRWGAPVVAFLATAAVLALTSRDATTDPADAVRGPAASEEGIAAPTEERIAQLQDAVRAEPQAASGYSLLGDAYLQRARETADASYYHRAERAFAAAESRDPTDISATLGEATLALARHDFAGGLALGKAAARAEPALARPLTVIADGQIELGRYRAAERTVDRLVAIKPTLAAYTRVSYLRELDGDLDGAVQAMRFAASAGAGTVEGSAYVQTLLGNLEVQRGNDGAAKRAYDQALALDAEYAPALAGLARLDAAAGREDDAIRELGDVVTRLPLPEYTLSLAETEQAAGRTAAAERDLALVEAQAKLLRASGVNTDVEIARFEADHGDPRRGVELGRAAWRAAPSVTSADALSWALFRAGDLREAVQFSERAMALGSRNPVFLFHAGMIAQAEGDEARSRSLLGDAAGSLAALNPVYADEARHALEELG